MDEKERAPEPGGNPEAAKEEQPSEEAKKLKEEMKTSFSTYLTISQVGLVMIIPMILGAAFGHWLDRKFGTDGLWSVLLLLLGIAGGFYGAYNQIAAVIKKKK